MKNTVLVYSELIDQLQVEKIICYGTLSTEISDLDLVIVSNDFESMFIHKRLNITKRYIKSNRKLDLICLTNAEYKKLKSNPNSFSLNILIKGELIYERRI